MVVAETEILSQSDVESPLAQENRQKAGNPASAFTASLGRQSSIYSLTLDEFQNTLLDGGKNFGSMNMDEFLASIWTAEENTNNSTDNNNSQFSQSDTSMDPKTGISKQPSLQRQGSLSLPVPLCRKTVDEVWSEIHKQQQNQQRKKFENATNSKDTRRQPTFGEMTLEDFLIRAGVVREQGTSNTSTAPPRAPPPQEQPYDPYHGNSKHQPVGSTFVSRPVFSSGGVHGHQNVNPVNAGGYPAVIGCFGTGGRVANGGGGGGYGYGLASPVSPISSDGMCSQGDNSAARNYAMDMVGSRGRKRIVDGPVEKVVERRQRRMIKNRESAARSRARKQAYTVELEAELNHLKEENAQLRQALAEGERDRKQEFHSFNHFS